MEAKTRDEQMAEDFAAMESLKKASSIVDFHAEGSPPYRYTVTFLGKGVRRDTSPGLDVEVVETHQCELRLPLHYPNCPPDIRWLTPIFHPNVSFSGFINLRDLGIPWTPSLGLEVVVERLWDATRLAFFNFEKSCNYAAKAYFEDACTLRLPIDARPLRDKEVRKNHSNIIRYERLGKEKQTGRSRTKIHIDESSPLPDRFYIGEETTAPPPPERPPRFTISEDDMPADSNSPSPQNEIPAGEVISDEPSSQTPDDDDILYIGYD